MDSELLQRFSTFLLCTKRLGITLPMDVRKKLFRKIEWDYYLLEAFKDWSGFARHQPNLLRLLSRTPIGHQKDVETNQNSRK